MGLEKRNNSLGLFWLVARRWPFDALQADRFRCAEFLRPKGYVEFLEHPAQGLGLFHECFMAWAGWFALCFRHGVVGELFGFVGFPCPAYVAVLVVFRLGEAQQVGVQVSFDGRQCVRWRLADETGEDERGDVLADRLQHAQQG